MKYLYATQAKMAATTMKRMVLAMVKKNSCLASLTENTVGKQ